MRNLTLRFMVPDYIQDADTDYWKLQFKRVLHSNDMIGANISDTVKVSQNEEGMKLDDQKTQLGLVILGFAESLLEISKVADYGAKKYAPNNWKKLENGQDRYTNAMLRHLLAEQTDGPLDPETGLLHSAHAAWNALARLWFQLKDQNLER